MGHENRIWRSPKEEEDEQTSWFVSESENWNKYSQKRLGVSAKLVPEQNPEITDARR